MFDFGREIGIFLNSHGHSLLTIRVRKMSANEIETKLSPRSTDDNLAFMLAKLYPFLNPIRLVYSGFWRSRIEELVCYLIGGVWEKNNVIDLV